MATVYWVKQAPSTAQHNDGERGFYALIRGWKWAIFWRDGRCTPQWCVFTLQLPPNTCPVLAQEQDELPPAVARATTPLDSSEMRNAHGCWLDSSETRNARGSATCAQTRTISTGTARGRGDVLTRLCALAGRAVNYLSDQLLAEDPYKPAEAFYSENLVVSPTPILRATT
ncbi:hypothetical protein B0H14DRAFT_3152420 [Mycena olivaceomarginata]|nr:hypothetical protein B0H14DRAFT_3152420 [Mycena olivaceomarginata]